jgi:hypothetical protein
MYSRRTYNKYRNVRCEQDGFKFDSRKERERYLFLKELQANGGIRHLMVHPTYELQESFVNAKGEKRRAIKYEADFGYITNKDAVVIEDVKPFVKKTGKFFMTAEAKIKHKMFEFKYPELTITLI